jgi:hypothetical protein
MMERDEMVQQVFLVIMKGVIDNAIANKWGLSDQLDSHMIATYKDAAINVVDEFWGEK